MSERTETAPAGAPSDAGAKKPRAAQPEVQDDLEAARRQARQDPLQGIAR